MSTIFLCITSFGFSQQNIIPVNTAGTKYTSLSGRIITSRQLQDYNSFDEPNKIHPKYFKDAELFVNSLQLKLPPFSVVVLTLK
ncbi:MAG: alpha-L-arabinofuranosidase C-terminal domain-containing protein [Chitinophagaceae bacterium]